MTVRCLGQHGSFNHCADCAPPVAYDYDAQRWVEGDAAVPLLLDQARDTLSVIDRPDYQRMMGYTAAQAEAIRAEAQRTLREGR